MTLKFGTPIPPHDLVRALQAAGVRVVEHPGWLTNNRNHRGKFEPFGVLIHHTVTKGAKNTVDLCFRGHANLPGPLCQIVVTKDGTVHMVGNGRANHAGGGDPDVLRSVRNREAPQDRPPTDKHEGEDGAADGNRPFYGLELENLGDGKDPWPEAQTDAAATTSAVILGFYGDRDGRACLGHLEWSDWKSDPRGFGMDWFRQEVTSELARLASPPATPRPDTRPAVSLAKLRAAARRDPSAPQGSAAPATRTHVLLLERALVRVGVLAARWADGSYGSKTWAAVQDYQQAMGFTGDDADGLIGTQSLARLAAKTKLFRAAP